MARNAVLNVIFKGKDEVSGVIDGVSGRMRGLPGALGRVGSVVGDVVAGAGMAAVAVGSVAAATYHLLQQAAPLQGIQVAFEGITEAAGLSGEAVLDAMRTASSGTITNVELMRQYNRATQMVGNEFANELPAALGAMGRISAATGTDINYLLDSYTTGISRLSPMILDNLNIQVDMNQAMQDYAASNDLVASQMTKAQQQAALQAQVNQMLQENTEDLPDVNESVAVSFDRINTALGNMRNTIMLNVLPAVTPLIERLSTWVAESAPEVAEFISGPLADAFSGVAELLGIFPDFTVDDMRGRGFDPQAREKERNDKLAAPLIWLADYFANATSDAQGIVDFFAGPGPSPAGVGARVRRGTGISLPEGRGAGGKDFQFVVDEQRQSIAELRDVIRGTQNQIISILHRLNNTLPKAMRDAVAQGNASRRRK